MKKAFFLLVFLMMPFVAWGQEQVAVTPGDPADIGSGKSSFFQVRQLRRELRLSQEAYARLKDLYAKKEAEIKELSGRISSFSGEFGDLQKLIERLKKEKDELLLNQGKVAQRFKDLEQQKVMMEEQAKDLMKEKNALAAAAEDARKRLGQSDDAVAKSEAEKLGMRTELEKLRKAPDLAPEIAQAKQKLVEVQADRDAVTAELARLKKIGRAHV